MFFTPFDIIVKMTYLTRSETFKFVYLSILILHGPPMLVDKTSFGLVLYNPTNFYRFEETHLVID